MEQLLVTNGGKNTVLAIKNLSVSFHSGQQTVKAVDNLNLSIEHGTTLGLVGESGSGKSVTALSIMRLLNRSAAMSMSGIVNFTNEAGRSTDLLSVSEKELRRFRGRHIGMVFQEPMTSLNPVFRCGKQILEAVRQHDSTLTLSEARHKVMDLLEQVRLSDPARAFSAYPHQLSGGQKQRIMIAMAISCQPDLLIADEPTTALDVTVQRDILDLLKTLQSAHGMSMLFISHDLGVISQVADEVAVMYRGKLLEQAPARTLFDKPRHPYTKGLLACRPPLDRQLTRLPVVADFLTATDKQLSVDSRLSQLNQPQSVVVARRQKLYAADPLIRVQGLSTWFASQKNFIGHPTAFLKAVNEVSFDVYPGEMLGLVGESGCGKTTLGRTLMRLVEPREGAVFFGPHNLMKVSDRDLRSLRRNFQMVFQDPYASLNPRMTVGQAILEPMEVHRYPDSTAGRRDRVVELLEAVGLSAEHAVRYPHEFSGGQRQRICIARALALSPTFILFDESVSALDVSVQAQVLNLLLDLRDRYNFSCLFISHDLSVVRFLCDKIMVMKDGVILETGWPEDIFNAPAHQYTRDLVEAIPVVASEGEG